MIARDAGFKNKDPATVYVTHKTFFLHDAKDGLGGLVIGTRVQAGMTDHILHRALANLPQYLENPHFCTGWQNGVGLNFHRMHYLRIRPLLPVSISRLLSTG